MLAQVSPALSGHCLFEGIVRQISEAIIFADRDGVIRVWNRGAEALFGFSALDIIVPERFGQAHWDGFHRAIAQGHAQHDAQIRTARGSTRQSRSMR